MTHSDVGCHVHAMRPVSSSRVTNVKVLSQFFPHINFSLTVHIVHLCGIWWYIGRAGGFGYVEDE